MILDKQVSTLTDTMYHASLAVGELIAENDEIQAEIPYDYPEKVHVAEK